MAVYEIAEFRVGKQTRRGVPKPTKPFPVTVVTRDSADAFFRWRSPEEKQRHLQGLRDLGILVTNRGRLTQRVRLEDGSKIRCYVVRGAIEDVPRRRRREPVGVVEWY